MPANANKETRRKTVRNTVVSVIIGGVIVWFLLSKIDVLDVPRTIGRISLWSLLLAFALYVISVFLKSLRFKIILRTDMSLKRLFPIISLYTFFANILPMRAGELSYVYFLKKEAETRGTKSVASLIAAGIADAVVILIAMFIVGWRLKSALAEGISRFRLALWQRIEANFLLIAIIGILLFVGIITLILLRRRLTLDNRESRIQRIVSSIRAKVLEVWRELVNVSLDARLLGIIVFSVLIIAFRLATQWYLVRAMGIGIGIWQVSFALLFGVLFSLLPIHGPAGFGTVEGPWVLTLSVLGVSLEDAITSGIGLHIIIIMYCVILGISGIIGIGIARRHSAGDACVAPTSKNV
jgi:uncharacterized membrane protein YbhN (UPF0104 family)